LRVMAEAKVAETDAYQGINLDVVIDSGLVYLLAEGQRIAIAALAECVQALTVFRQKRGSLFAFREVLGLLGGWLWHLGLELTAGSLRLDPSAVLHITETDVE